MIVSENNDATMYGLLNFLDGHNLSDIDIKDARTNKGIRHLIGIGKDSNGIFCVTDKGEAIPLKGISGSVLPEIGNQLGITESLILELQKDKDDLKAHLGDDLFDDYMKIRDRISDSDWKDFGKLKKKDPEEIKDFVDNFQSKTSKKKEDAAEYSKKIYSDSDWLVLRITGYPAARKYGEGTTWCITGRYNGHEEQGEYWFNKYINDENLDGGYYFFINNHDNSEKYCLLLTKYDKVHSIWNAEDNECQPEELLDIADELPFGDAMEEYIEHGGVDKLWERLENAYDDDNFETWAYTEYDLAERDEWVDFPSYETLIEDNKPNMFSGLIHEFGIEIDKNEYSKLIALAYENSDHPDRFIDELPDDKFDYMFDAFCNFSDIDKQMDFFNDYPCCDLASLIKNVGFENLCAYLDSTSYDADEYFADCYDQKEIEDAVDWEDEDPEDISKFLHYVEDTLNQDISDFFTDVDELNLYYLIEDYLDKPDTITADAFNLITTVHYLGANLNSDEAKELKETLDSMDENKRNKIDSKVVKIIEENL